MFSREVKTGLAVLAAIVLLYLLMAWGTSSGFWAEEEARYFVDFENVDGLIEGDPVDIRGYRSGKVLSIIPSAKGVQVEISLNNKVKLQADAFAEIQVKELMGSKQVSISPGTSLEQLAAGARIPGTKALDFTSAFSKLGDGLDKIDFERLNTVFYRLDTLSQKLGKAADAVSPDEIHQLASGLNQATSSINLLVNGLNRTKLPQRLDTALTQFGDLAETADLALKRFDALAATMDDHTLPRADSLMLQLGDFLSKTELTLNSADGLFQQLRDPNTVAGKLLNDPNWVPLMDSTLVNLNKTLIHIRRHKVHVALSLSGKKKTYKE